MGEYLYCEPSSPLPLILTPEILGIGGRSVQGRNFGRHSELPTVPPSSDQAAGTPMGAASLLDLGAMVSSSSPPPAVAHRLRVFQALSPSRIAPGLAWGSKLNLRPPMWMQVDASYFSAPGGVGRCMDSLMHDSVLVS